MIGILEKSFGKSNPNTLITVQIQNNIDNIIVIVIVDLNCDGLRDLQSESNWAWLTTSVSVELCNVDAVR
jgi:hypothetical protein